jgi:glycosyltransferase involved in cell wall biosynthesis
MKILQVIPSISPSMGGPTQVILNIVRAIRQLGVDAEIVTTNDDGQSFLDVPLYERIEYEQVPVRFFPRSSYRMKDYLFSAEITPWLWQHLSEYDLVETHYLFSYVSTCAATMARWQGIPYLIRTMGQLTPWALQQSRFKKQIYSGLLERRNLEGATAIHCTTLGEAADVRGFGIQTPTVTLPLGVSPPSLIADAQDKLKQAYGIAGGTPVILFLSRLHYKKRPDLLLYALKELADRNYDFHVILAGSGEPEYEAELKGLAASLGLLPQLSMPGFVAGAAKDLLLQGSDLFVLPSFSENFGIAVAEAMATGLPVVLTAGVQISPEVSRFQTGLVIEGEVKPLADAIAQLLDSSELRHRLGENGRQFVRQYYSWEAIAKNLISAYSAIVQRQPLPEHFSNAFVPSSNATSFL